MLLGTAPNTDIRRSRVGPLNWTEARTAQLKELVADGLSAGQIMAQMGHLTRSAVIGKCYRLGLHLQGGDYLVSDRKPKRERRRGKSNNPFGQKGRHVFDGPPKLPTAPVIRTTGAHPGSRLITQPDLDMNLHCRWIVGASTWPATHCGADRQFPGDDGKSCYCAVHRAAAWRPA